MSILKTLVNRLLPVGTKNDIYRDTWIEKQLTLLSAGSKILDAGAGEGRYKNLCGRLIYVAQDFAQYDGRGDNVGLQTGTWVPTELDIVSDIVDIPEASASFDAILCSEVFEHVPNPIGAIQEFARLLKKGGQLFLTAPFASLTHFAPFHFYSGFNRYFYEKHLRDNGFEIVEMLITGNYFEYLGQELRRTPYVAARYTNSRVKFWEYPILIMALLIMNRLSKGNTGSEEILCFNHCVRAQKT